MISNDTPIGFELSISGRNDGTVEAVYIHLGKGRVSRTRELAEDILLADYDSRGRLLGFEILAPVRLADLTRHVDEGVRRPFRRFLLASLPAEILMDG